MLFTKPARLISTAAAERLALLRSPSSNVAGPSTLSRALHSSSPTSSGSNKWSKIRHKKAANDQAKGTAYSSLSREIMASIRNHPTRSSAPDANPRLAMLLRKAKDMAVPKDKLEATLAKATKTSSEGMHSLTFEALGPPPSGATGGSTQPVSLLIECSTDSPTRCHSKMKEALHKNDARLSSTAHLFQRTGVLRLTAAEGKSFDEVWEAAVEGGAEDVREWYDEATGDENGVEIICAPTDVNALSKLLSSPPHSHQVHTAETQMIASGPVMRLLSEREEVSESEAEADEVEASTSGWVSDDYVDKLDKLLEAMEEGADCQRVWSNLEGWPAR